MRRKRGWNRQFFDSFQVLSPNNVQFVFRAEIALENPENYHLWDLWKKKKNLQSPEHIYGKKY